MKKMIILLLITLIAIFSFAGCSNTDDKIIKIGASPTPHSEILELAREELEENGYTLEIVEFTDFVQPNLTVDSGNLDANYFQHQPYLDDFNENNNTKLVTIATIHYEPLGIYPGKTTSLADLEEGATIAVPNDPTNEARALLLLETAGLIKIDPNAGLTATINDITYNPNNYQVLEIEAAQVPRTLQDVDLGVINGNYALLSNLNVNTDALVKEEKESLSATTYANILVVREGNENNEKLQALVEALKSDKVKQFIEEKYNGSVVPVF
ncbi:metal ABC transporter substrate-binding protein [Alkalibaculum sp. M08DMB]|uniref:Lipoprotein n=1 Tax=Alkalibaculum sporogenes TaxID=2655001 RepID=A0A6A7K9P2_9FIRM|nr:MetQ/NlpA family ABC transporter substrate-binding protein [Alkalibaculum sporogenes]MPW26180.1 metal ABC transporter substrate-binding protein [Alkalibaculum sporogenes]